MKALLLAGAYPPDAFELVREPADDVEIVLTMPEAPVGEELMARLPALRAIGTATVGFDHIDVEAASRRGIAVVSVPDYCTEEVADHTLALIFALLRGVVAFAHAPWDAKAAGPLRTIAGLRVGVVGLGRIGSAVASRLRALGAEVWANDIREIPDNVALYDLLAACDVVTLHVPLTSETRKLIGRAEIEVMKPDALLVNTARGAVVDLDAVLVALRSRKLGGAALDVLPIEPPPMRPAAPNLILTPHAAYYSEAAEERSYRLCVARVRDVLGR